LSVEAYFDTLARAADAALRAGEAHTMSFAGEATDFVRMNRGKVRQPGHVEQRSVALRLANGARHASHLLTLTGSATIDRDAIASAVAQLRGALASLPEDPHLLLPDTVTSSRSLRSATVPPAAAIVDDVLTLAKGHDLVGMLATGAVHRGFADSRGQRNWHAVDTFNLQWSLYHRADKAVRSSYSGLDWSADELRTRVAATIDQLALVSRPAKTIAPGQYRAFLTPAAMQEITDLLHWGGFSARALETQQSALAKMRADARFDPRVAFSEDIADGVAPAFQNDGFARPANTPLITDGKLTGALVSPRTAREFGLATNGANASESPEALSMAAGDLAAGDVLAALDTGLAIGNLWYLNYSDRPAARMTGMTRFATFWVEGGKIVAPVDVMRFDDTLFRMLGDNLEALTAKREMLLEANTYGERVLSSVTLPGALLRSLSFTL
jgi:predicted Zn-dependent protease